MKSNKKGFTLIELLAVIAILAILIVIAVPAVLDLFSTSKKNAFVTQAQSLFKAAEQEVITTQIDGNPIPTRFCYVYVENSSALSTADTVELEGTKKVSYDIVLTNGKITSFAVSNGDYSITAASSDLSVSDIENVDGTRTAVADCN